ncbi:unnamed protein product [Rotaria sp. Silwood2]|nr:unnamed protein product [Rotaria sp. Silwood2]
MTIGGGSSCTSEECKRQGIIVGIVFGSIFGACILCACCVCLMYRLKKCLTGKTLRSNWIFVNIALKCDMFKTQDTGPFQSGTWSSRYYQYGRWHDQYQLSLSFDPKTFKVEGSGSDDVGDFTIAGTYSIKTQRIGLKKTYQSGTGNTKENLGHTVTIQLKWNSTEGQFEGKWYVQTNRYHGENKCEFKIENFQQPSMDQIFTKV